MQCFAIACLITVLWIVYGYSLAFSGGGDFIGNLDKAFLSGVTRDSLSGTLPETVFVMFQLTFAIITPAGVIIAKVNWNMTKTVSGKVPLNESLVTPDKNALSRFPIKSPPPENARL